MGIWTIGVAYRLRFPHAEGIGIPPAPFVYTVTPNRRRDRSQGPIVAAISGFLRLFRRASSKCDLKGVQSVNEIGHRCRCSEFS